MMIVARFRNQVAQSRDKGKANSKTNPDIVPFTVSTSKHRPKLQFQMTSLPSGWHSHWSVVQSAELDRDEIYGVQTIRFSGPYT